MAGGSKKKKREAEEALATVAAAGGAGDAAKKAKVGKKDKKEKPKPKKVKKEFDSDDEMDTSKTEEDLPPEDLPPAELLNAMIDRVEALLPKDDAVKFDSRAKKIDWSKVAFEGMDADGCKKWWHYIQERIRRFRIMAEMLPDARTWVSQPWTNFYKSKDHNRHPDCPKKPLSMYMLFYSEMREVVLKTNPKMSMPEVAKACSEKYAKLSEKRKGEYKARCEEMRKEYEAKLSRFYEENPQMRPVKAKKHKKASPAVVATGTTMMNLTQATPINQATAATNQTTSVILQQPAQTQQTIQYGTTSVSMAGMTLANQQATTLTYAPSGMTMQAQQPLQQQQFANNVVTIAPQQQTQQIYQTQTQQSQQQPPIVAQAIAAVTAANSNDQMVQYQQYNQPMTIPVTFKAEDQMQPVQVQLAPAQMGQQIGQQPVTIQPQPAAPIQYTTTQQTVTATPAAAPTPPQPVVTLASSPTKSQSQVSVGTTSVQQQAHVVPSSNLAYPNAPERPPKPFDLYLKSEMDSHVNEMNFDRQQCVEKCRLDWKNMKTKKKAKWIQLALDEYKKYEERVGVFMRDNSGYVPPEKKNFLTQEDQKILDKSMGRPEKPPSSAYSLFSKEMLNNPEIKQYPSKERMTQISIKYKMLDQMQKDHYQAQVNESMAVYRQEYENWFNNLNDEQRQAETARTNTAKNKKFNPAPPGATASASGIKEVTQQGCLSSCQELFLLIYFSAKLQI